MHSQSALKIKGFHTVHTRSVFFEWVEVRTLCVVAVSERGYVSVAALMLTADGDGGAAAAIVAYCLRVGLACVAQSV